MSGAPVPGRSFMAALYQRRLWISRVSLMRSGAAQGSYIALACAIRTIGFSTIGRFTSADKFPNRIESHHTTS